MYKGLVLLLVGFLLPLTANADKAVPSLYLSFEDVVDSGLQISDALLQGTYQLPQMPEQRGGVAGLALMFDGYSTRAVLDDFYPTGGDMSLCVWLAPRAFPARGDGEKTVVTQCEKMRFSQSGFSLGIAPFGQIAYRLTVQEPNGRSTLYSETLSYERYPTLKAGEWNHLALVFDTQEAEARIYLNGQCIYKQTFPKGSQFLPAQRQAFLVGDDINAEKVHGIYSLGAYSGLMDELYWFDIALTDEEVKEKASVIPACSADVTYNRSRVAPDRYRPSYHIQGGQMWMNEAIAPLYVQEQYHLFYQTNLSGPYYRQATWGHMISEDLIHWTDLPAALIAQPGDIDPDACFSGNAAIDANGIPHLFYTGVRLGGRILNRITSAVPASTDMIEWQKSQSVLIEHPDDCSTSDFRDPFIYEEGEWAYMLIASTTKGATNVSQDDDEPLVVVYRAPKGNYEHWERLGTLLKGNRQRWPESGSCWECPVFFRLSDVTGQIHKYFLAVSVTGNNISVYYWIGDFDPSTGVFTPDTLRPTRLDQGMLNLVGASTGFVDPQTGAALITSTVNDGRSEQERFYSGWSGFNTLWRHLQLKPDGSLSITPMERYEALHQSLLCESLNYPISHINQQLVPCNGSAHINMRFRESEDVTICIGEATGKHVRLSYDSNKHLLTLDTIQATPATNTMRGISQGEVPVTADGMVNLDVYIDHCVVEAFANEGLCMTGILLSEDTMIPLSLEGNAEMVIDEMRVWQMP